MKSKELSDKIDQLLEDIGARIGAVSGCRPSPANARVLGEHWRPRVAEVISLAEQRGAVIGAALMVSPNDEVHAP